MQLPEIRERPLKDILKSLDAYIEFAQARNAFADMYFYRELKHLIERMEA